MLLRKAELRNTPAKDGLAAWLLDAFVEVRPDGETHGVSLGLGIWC